MKNKQKILLTIWLSIVLVCVVFIAVKKYNDRDRFAKSVGELRTKKNKILQSNINSYLEVDDIKSDWLGKENLQCSNQLLGYDDKYAYAWVLCEGFLINANGKIEDGTSQSVPTRVEYSQPGFKIVKYDEPSDGAGFDESLRKIFPEKMYDKANPVNGEFGNLGKENLEKAKQNTNR